MSLKKRIGIYCRVSSREQAIHGYGIDVQKSKIKDYIKLFEIQVESITYYIDEGVSAKNLNREAVKKLIEDVKANKLDVVYIYKLDRLSRNVVDVYNLVETFTKYNCNLVALMDNIDVNSANGRLFVGILAIIAQWERETILERTADGVEEMVKSGKWPYGSKPYGYDKNKDLTLRYNFQEVAHIKYINKKAREGYTIKEIQNFLLEKFNVYISADRVKKIILKPWYHGVFIFNQQEYYDICPAVYSEVEALEAQKMIAKRFKTYNDNRYYFGNKVNCVCGEVLEHKSTKKKDRYYFYYYCSNCKKRVNQTYLIEHTLYAISTKVNEVHTINNNDKALAKLGRINRKIQNLHDKYINSKLDMNIYLMSLYKLEYSKKDQIAKIKTDKLIDFIKWEEMNDLERSKFISNHIKKVVVDVKNNIVINIDYLQK